jgi:hypothetical protein
MKAGFGLASMMVCIFRLRGLIKPDIYFHTFYKSKDITMLNFLKTQLAKIDGKKTNITAFITAGVAVAADCGYPPSASVIGVLIALGLYSGRDAIRKVQDAASSPKP